MRYRSLRFIALSCHFIGIVGVVSSVFLFILLAIGAIEVLHRMFLGRALGFENYAAVLVTPSAVLLIGLISSVVTFAMGTFLIVIMDIEENTRSIDYKLGNAPGRNRSMNAVWDEEDSSLAPSAPKPWASFPPKPDYMNKAIPPPPGAYDERLRDMKRR